MDFATCIKESVYSDALTRGGKYPVLAVNDDGKQIKIEADNKRQRWFPSYCFDLTGSDVPAVTNVVIRSELEEPLTAPVEVVVELSNGQARWCFFATPDTLTTVSQIRLDGGTVNMYGAPHLIVVSTINEDIIVQALESINKLGELMECTLPVDQTLPQGSSKC